ncbi:MAG: magnesium-translocating P-type ATPase [Gemmatimonadota bacterium]
MAAIPTPAAPADWSQPEEDLLQRLQSRATGLSSAEAADRLARDGPNLLKPARRIAALRTFAAQFKSPLVLILVFAAGVSVLTRDWLDALIVLTIIVASALLSFMQEYRAGRAVERLLARITLRATVLRDGQPASVPAHDIVCGDVVVLSAGSLIPADGRVLAADDFFVNQAVLTGETFPVEKHPGVVADGGPLAGRTNCVFMGTNVRSGTAQVLVTATGTATEYGRIAATLALRAPETEFERSIRRFGNLLTQIMTLLVLAIFAANVAYDRPWNESLLFAVALAVGLAPELLPAIISLTLARGAQRMARAGVIVRRLAAIENFGSMDVLCTDKTGTLTLGVIRLDGALDADGNPSERVLELAWLNARLQTGLQNPLDEAILASGARDAARWQKTEEIPYDFVRKRMTVAVHGLQAADDLLITKGALEPALAVCASLRQGGATSALDDEGRAALTQRAEQWADQGFRVLAVATREMPKRAAYTVADEVDLVFEGFLLFFDPPKPDAAEAIDDLKRLGVELKIITGDSRRVAQHVARAVDLPADAVVTGAQLRDMRDEALWQLAERTTIFAEVDPNQKERIIAALRRTGHVVGYLGDGINDAPALHTADVGVSVDTAVDVAKETADFVLLEHSLTVLRQGIEEGRSVFANTLKYVYTTSSANFGNMISMAGLSLVLPFLPLLPKQILLNNFLSDVPAMTIAGDRVDEELIQRPRRWRVAHIRNFMLGFGLLSSIFDVLTFVVLLIVLRASEDEFRTAWFVESLLTELAILLVVRTQRPLIVSEPSRPLLWATVGVAATALALPYLPVVAATFGFVPLPALLVTTLIAITLAYLIANEIAKRAFHRRFGF